jgi:squalene-hopene/tetraprenyl-beta-curcumene cyclase
LGLIAAGRARSQAVERGIDYLIETQLADGSWEEASFTGTGFPRVFYLRYHYYRVCFPLMAIARYQSAREQRQAGASPALQRGIPAEPLSLGR